MSRAYTRARIVHENKTFDGSFVVSDQTPSFSRKILYYGRRRPAYSAACVTDHTDFVINKQKNHEQARYRNIHAEFVARTNTFPP